MKPFHNADHWVFMGCLFIACWFFGYEFGRIQYDKPCMAPSIHKPSLPAHGRETRQWSRYLAARGQM